MWWLDFPTLVLIIAAGFQVGLQAMFGIDAAHWMLGGADRILFVLMGFSSLWQLFRQRFR